MANFRIASGVITSMFVCLSSFGLAQAADYSSIYGKWTPTDLPCHLSDAYWVVSKKGAVQFDTLCKLQKVEKTNKSTFKFTQECNMEGTIEHIVVDIKRISSKRVMIYGMPHNRCPMTDG